MDRCLHLPTYYTAVSRVVRSFRGVNASLIALLWALLLKVLTLIPYIGIKIAKTKIVDIPIGTVIVFGVGKYKPNREARCIFRSKLT